MSENKRLDDYRQIQAARYEAYMKKKQAEEDKIKQEQEELEKQENEKKRIEEEAKMLLEMQLREEYEEFLIKLESLIAETQTAKNIIEIDVCVISFVSLIENHMQYIDNENTNQEVVGKIMEMVNAISQNSNSKFDITKQNEEKEAADRIINGIKSLLQLANVDEANMDIEVMDTIGDEEIAKKMQEEHDKELANQNNENDLLQQIKIHRHPKLMRKPKTNGRGRGNIINTFKEMIGGHINQNIGNFPEQNNNSKFTGVGYKLTDDHTYTVQNDEIIDLTQAEINELLKDETESTTPFMENTHLENAYLENTYLENTHLENAYMENIYYAGFDQIADPDLVQLMHYQNELLDQ